MQLVDEQGQLSVADVEVHDEANRRVAHASRLDALALQRPQELFRTQAPIESEDHDICFDGKHIRYVRKAGQLSSKRLRSAVVIMKPTNVVLESKQPRRSQIARLSHPSSHHLA